MADKLNSNFLIKKWVHSREEDTEDLMVFRPSTHEFAPTRGGRMSLDIKIGGKLIKIGKGGADDRQDEFIGSWKIENNTLILDDGKTKTRYSVAFLDQKKMIIKLK